MLDIDPQQPTALVDFPRADGERERWHFAKARQWLVAHDPMQVPALLDAAHAQAQAGRWCVGWVAYEAAPGLNPELPVKATAPGAVYAVWAVFDEAQAGWPDAPKAPEGGDWHMGPWQSSWTVDQARERIDTVHALIRHGEADQIQLTEGLQAPWQASPRTEGDEAPQTTPTAALHACFQALHHSQPDGHTLFLDGRAATRQPGVVMSVSPEQFLDCPGGQAHAQARPRLSELMASAFPCESVTGAPQRQAMHHIARLESAPRGVYGGVAGLMRPGGHITLHVPTCALSVHTPPPPAPWRAECRLGSGIAVNGGGA